MNQRRTSLLNQIVAANVLMVTATLFVAVLVAGGDFGTTGNQFEFLIIAVAMVGNLILNLAMLRRYFSPLESLISGSSRSTRLSPAASARRSRAP